MSLFEDDKLKTFKKRLLAVLEEEEVQRKLWEVVALGEAAPAAPVQDVSEKEAGPSEGDLEAKEQLIQQYREAHENDQRTISQLESERNQLAEEKRNISVQCRRLERDLDAARGELIEQKNTYEEQAQRQAGALHSCKQELKQQRQQIEQLQQQAVEQQAVVAKWERVAAPFEEALELYGKVQALSPAVKKRVRAYFKVQTPVSFLVSMGEENNLLQLWNIAKEEIKNCSKEDKSTLNALLAYTIDRVNELHETPRYALRQDKPGEKFDDRAHIRASGSSPYSGPIQEVILLGIDREGKVWKQSVVRV